MIIAGWSVPCVLLKGAAIFICRSNPSPRIGRFNVVVTHYYRCRHVKLVYSKQKPPNEKQHKETSQKDAAGFRNA
jgi:hypothetical protein